MKKPWLLLLLAPTLAGADQLGSVDCAAAERVVEHLERTSYVVTYCSSCSDYAQLLHMTGATVRPPGLDDPSCGVLIRGIPIARSVIEIRRGDYSPDLQFLDLTGGPRLRPALWQEIDLAYVYAYSEDAGAIVTLGAIAGLKHTVPAPSLLLPPDLQERVVGNLPGPDVDMGAEDGPQDCVGAAQRTVASGELAPFAWEFCWAWVQRWVEAAILDELADAPSDESLRSQAEWSRRFGAICVDKLAGSESGSGYGRALGRCRLEATLDRLNQLRGAIVAD